MMTILIYLIIIIAIINEGSEYLSNYLPWVLCSLPLIYFFPVCQSSMENIISITHMSTVITFRWIDICVIKCVITACSAPNHYLNQCGLIVIWTHRKKFLWNFSHNMIDWQQNQVTRQPQFMTWPIWKSCLQNGVHFVPTPMCYWIIQSGSHCVINGIMKDLLTPAANCLIIHYTILTSVLSYWGVWA